MPNLENFNQVGDEASKDWGAFRTWLSKHPLTGFWSGVGGGLVLAVLGYGALHWPLG